jgi:hypothetical protein
MAASETVTAVTVEGQLPAPRNEAVARELAPLRDQPTELRETWAQAVEEHGPTPTAAQVREVRQARHAPARRKAPAKRRSSGEFSDADRFVDRLVKRWPPVAFYALERLERQLYGVDYWAVRRQISDGPWNVPRDTIARRCRALTLKAFSTPEQPEAVALFEKARALVATHGLICEIEVGIPAPPDDPKEDV